MTVELKCRTHPSYKAIRKPTANCDDCRKLFRLKTQLERAPGAARKPQASTVAKSHRKQPTLRADRRRHEGAWSQIA